MPKEKKQDDKNCKKKGCLLRSFDNLKDNLISPSIDENDRQNKESY